MRQRVSIKDSLERIAAEARVCTRCRLALSRTQAVPGAGDPNADLLLVGEAPGANEDQTGLPFQGMAGRFLDSALADLGLQRSTAIYIASVNKCRPPGNRAPKSDEIAACAPFLDRQIALLQPRVVMAMGATAALRQHPEPPRPLNVTELRGLPVPLAPDRVLIVSYHPAAAMRFPDRREPFLSDLRSACWMASLSGSR
jgi:DNA polymerase